MENRLSEFIKKFDPEKVSKKEARKIAEGAKEIIEDHLISRGLPTQKRDEFISFTPYLMQGVILLKPNNILSAMALDIYSSAISQSIDKK